MAAAFGTVTVGTSTIPATVHPLRLARIVGPGGELGGSELTRRFDVTDQDAVNGLRFGSDVSYAGDRYTVQGIDEVRGVLHITAARAS